MKNRKIKYKKHEIVAFCMPDGFCAYLIYGKDKLVYYEFNYWDGELKTEGQAVEKAKKYIDELRSTK